MNASARPRSVNSATRVQNVSDKTCRTTGRSDGPVTANGSPNWNVSVGVVTVSSPMVILLRALGHRQAGKVW